MKQKKLTRFLEQAGIDFCENARELSWSDVVEADKQELLFKEYRTDYIRAMKQQQADLFIIGTAGTCGTFLTANLMHDEVEQFFGHRFAAELCRKSEFNQTAANLFLNKLCEKGDCVYPVGDGGVSGALMRLCEESGGGMRIDYHKVPVEQKTIELCECFGLDPWSLFSGEAYLVVSCRKEIRAELNELTQKTGIPAGKIGCLKNSKEKEIHYKEETDLFQRPGQDGLLEILKRKLEMES